MKRFYLNFVLLFTTLLLINNVNAQTYYSMSSGAWASSIWSTTAHAGPSCSCQPAGGCTFLKTANIYNTITVSGCSTFTLSGGVIDIQTGGKLIINGNLTLSGTSSINVPSGDSLIVNGNFSISGSSAIITVDGFFKITGSATLSTSSQVSGTGGGSYGSLTSSGGACWCIGGSLPIKLVSFTAKKNESNSVNLNWVTASEINNDYFTIEKKVEQSDFTTLGEVKGKGNSNELQYYEYTDNAPYRDGISYYQLSQTDYNGNSASFPVLPFSFIQNTNPDFILFPNPSDGKSISILTSNKNIGGTMNICLYDIYGRAMGQKSFTVSQETMNLCEQLSLPQLNPGIYFVGGIINNRNYSVPIFIK